MSKVISNILVIGSGITGSSIGNILRGKSNRLSVSIFDKGYSPGGRISTSFNKGKDKQIELGMKYILPSYKTFCPIKSNMSYSQLLQNNLIRPSYLLDSKKLIYLPSRNYQDLIDFINRDIHIHSKCKVHSINKENELWLVNSDKGEEYFNCLIITIPINQIFEINGNFLETIKSDIKYNKLINVEYESNFALGLFFNKFDNIKPMTKNIKSKNIESIFIDNKKNYSTVVAHATHYWTMKNLNLPQEEIFNKLKNNVFEQVPDLNFENYQEHILKKWKYSKVKEGKEVDKKNKAIIVGDKKLPIIIAGDGIAGNGYENCVASAFESCRLLQDIILK